MTDTRSHIKGIYFIFVVIAAALIVVALSLDYNEHRIEDLEIEITTLQREVKTQKEVTKRIIEMVTPDEEALKERLREPSDLHRRDPSWSL